MTQLATITSKRQLTIPVGIFEELGLKEGEQVVVSEEKGEITIRPAKKLVEELAGSIIVPKRFKGYSVEKIIKIAKKEHFAKKK